MDDGASVRTGAAWRRSTTARRLARICAAAAGAVRGAQESKKEKEMRRLNAEGGKRFAPSPLFINGPEEIVRAGFTAHDLRNWRGVDAHDLAAIFGNCSHTARSAAQMATRTQRCGAALPIG